MKAPVSLLAAFVLMFCVVSPVLSEDNAAEKEKLKAEITAEAMKVGGAMDTFWTGAAIGAVAAAVLVPVSFLFEDKESKEYKIVLISAAGMGLTSVICMAWGGIEWKLCEDKLNELKKKEQEMSILPYAVPLAENGIEAGIILALRL